MRGREHEMEPVPPCRVLMRDFVRCDEVITARPRRDDFWGDGEDPGLVGAYVPEDPRLPSFKPGYSRGARPEITREQVEALREKGMPLNRIAQRLNCSYQTVYNRLHRSPKRCPAA